MLNDYLIIFALQTKLETRLQNMQKRIMRTGLHENNFI